MQTLVIYQHIKMCNLYSSFSNLYVGIIHYFVNISNKLVNDERTHAFMLFIRMHEQ